METPLTINEIDLEINEIDSEMSQIALRFVELAKRREKAFELKAATEQKPPEKKKTPAIKLTFEKKGRIIQWHGGQLFLGEKKKQSWLILKTIYESEKHYATLLDLEEKVWHFRESAGRHALNKSTIFVAIKRVFKAVKDKLPYKIKKIKNSQTFEIKGYKLICHPMTDNCYRHNSFLNIITPVASKQPNECK
jgi:hypothetical protein